VYTNMAARQKLCAKNEETTKAANGTRWRFCDLLQN